MPAFSAIIVCRDAVGTLPAAIDSVAWCDERVIVDSGSTDGTAELAREKADVFRDEPWRGYGQQKLFAMSLCRHPWVVILDADEEVTPELAQALRAMPESRYDALDVIEVPRRNYIFGRHARAWDPDWQARVVHRERAVFVDDALHDTCAPSAPGRGLRLRRRGAALLHKRTSRAGFEDYFGGERLARRLPMVAQQMYDRGRRATWGDLLLRPWVTAVKLLFLKGGIWDGAFGLLIAQKTAVTTQLKYAALWALQEEKKKLGKAPETSRAAGGK